MLKGYKLAALCIARANEEINFKLISELNRKLVSVGYRLFVYNTLTNLFWNTPSEDGEKAVFDLLDMDIADVVLVHEESIKAKDTIGRIIAKAHSCRTPVISIGGKYEKTANIDFDYEQGFECVVRHVLDNHGCKKIHYMGGMKDNDFSENRKNVVKRVAEEKGLFFDDSCVSYGEFWTRPARAAAEKIVEKGDIPDAVFCANDVMAMAVCAVFSEHGINVPDDSIVTGFDGLDDIFFFKPTITSCRYSFANLADKIVELILKYDNGESITGDYLVSQELVLNESCGCRKSPAVNAAKVVTEIGDRFYRYQNDDCMIHERMANIYCSEAVKQIYDEINTLNLYGVFALINSECTDERVNPMACPDDYSFSDEMCLLYRYSGDSSFDPCDFDRSEIAPELDYILETGNPLVFNALNFRDIPLGYVGFFFEATMTDYCRIPQVVNALNSFIGGFRMMRYQKYLTNRIDEISKRDMLTGLYNRIGFNSLVDDIMHNLKKDIAVISIDLDRLKYINDTFGHTEGDFAIRSVARALDEGCPGKKICARFGGDEFAAVTDECNIETITGSIQNWLDKFNAVSGKPYDISASIGVYVHKASDGYEDFEKLFNKSDKLMYEIKRKRKDNRL